MNISDLFNNKSIKPKEKTETLAAWILDRSLPVDELLVFAEKAKDPVKATCIEAIEFATKQIPEVADETILAFVSSALTSNAPRVKWESAKVIGNIAPLFPAKLEKSIANLLTNAEHEGTVVRWSAAFALGEILKMKTRHNKELLPVIESICEKEEKNSIRKIYLSAIKKINK